MPEPLAHLKEEAGERKYTENLQIFTDNGANVCVVLFSFYGF